MRIAWNLVLVAGAIACLAFAVPPRAQGLLGSQNKLDESFCKKGNIRETVVYVDDTIVITNQDSWFRTLYEKLAATLVPGERTTLVELLPATGQSAERWSGCWPAYTPAETAKLAGQTAIFTTSPLEALKQQQALFARGIGVAAKAIERANPHTAEQVIVDPNDPPQKSIIRALASDEVRFSHSQVTIRAIMYSNLVENSDLGSSLKSLPSPMPNYGAKLGTYLRRGVFYVFGVGSYLKNGGAAQDNIRAFWNEAFRSMAANVAGLGADLSVPNVVPTSARTFDLVLKDGGQTLSGRLALLVDDDGALVDSWLGIIRLRSAALNGTFRCRSKGGDQGCILQATTVGGVVSLSPVEDVSMTGPDLSAMTGTIGVPGSSVNLPLGASSSN